MSRAERIAGVSGIAGALMFGVGSAIWGLDMPQDGTPVPEVLEWYRGHRRPDRHRRKPQPAQHRCVSVLRRRHPRVLADAEGDDVLANTAFGGLLLAMAAGISAEGINLAAALRAQDDELGEDLGQSMFEISQIFGSALTAVGLGVFAVATAVVALRSGRVLPRWLAIFTLVLGVLLLTPVAHVNWVAVRRARPARPG